MKTRSRRRLGIALLTGGAVVAGTAAFGGAFVAGRQEEVGRYWTSAVVAADGSAQVTEVIDYDFGLNRKRGIFRWVPGLDPAAPITVSSPDAPDDAEVTPISDIDHDGNYREGAHIRIGDPSTRITGAHRYTIEYPLPGVRVGPQLDWEAVGTGWDVGMAEIEVHLVTPFEVDNPLCVYGPPRSDATCSIREIEPGHLVATVEDLDAGEGVSIEGTQGAALAATPAAPQPPTDPPADDSANPLAPAGVAAGATALAAAGTTLLVRRAGRETVYSGGAADAAFGGPPLGGSTPWPTAPRPNEPSPGGPSAFGPTAEAAWPSAPGPAASAVPPPPPVPGAELPMTGAASPVSTAAPAGGATAAPTYRTQPEPDDWSTVAAPAGAAEVRVDAHELEQMTTIEFAPPAGVSPAHGGIILREKVQAEHKVAWLIQAAIDGAIELDDTAGTRITRVAGAPATAEQAPILDQMFSGGSSIHLGTYDPQFATAWASLGSRLSAWRAGSGLWDRRGDSRRIVALVFGIMFALAGGVAVLVAGVLAGIGVAAPVWLALGAIGGLLAGAGLAAAIGAWELHVRSAAGSSLWLRIESFRRFLAESEGYHADEAARRGLLREYAAWAVAVGEIGRWTRAVESSTLAPQVAGANYVYMAPYLMMSTTSTATAPSTSSSGGGGFSGGGFGGGSVGGGAGGGGGGSW